MLTPSNYAEVYAIKQELFRDFSQPISSAFCTPTVEVEEATAELSGRIRLTKNND
jgi:hypothetical protein